MPTRKTPAAKKAPARTRTPTTPTPAAPEAAKKNGKAARPRLIRDGFTMPEEDYALIAVLKERALKAKREVKKSELLRAGLQALMQLDGPALTKAVGRLQPLKVGRPKKSG
jgi:hypothetical protein